MIAARGKTREDRRALDEPVLNAESWVALLGVAAAAIRLPLPMDVPSNLIVGLALLPVSLRYLQRYRGATVFALLAIAATLSGLILASSSLAETSNSLMVAQAARVASLAVVLPLFLWARTAAGTRRIILAFAVGMLANVAANGTNDANLWKFTFAAPLILLVLTLPGVYGRRIPQALAGSVLAVVSLFFDSRSLAGFLLVAVALTLTQRSASASENKRRRGTWTTLLRLAIVVLGAYFLLQAAILEGMLGDGIRVRTESQIQVSGSVLTGGRPEIGASFSLLTANPGGYGFGVLATPTDVLTAKSGMISLGYDPNNGYVERYMFGSGFEVHSVLGDMWILAGVLGAALALFAAVWLIRGMAHRVAAGAAAAVVIYVATRSLWDIGFSPIFTSIALLPLALAVVAEKRQKRVPVPTSEAPHSRAIH